MDQSDNQSRLIPPGKAEDALPPTDLLVCAATWMELKAWWPDDALAESLGSRSLAHLDTTPVVITTREVSLAITGIGIPATFLTLSRLTQQLRPGRILNIGIAGAYPNSGLEIGDIVCGLAEVFGDIGFELPDEPHYQPIQASPFIREDPASRDAYSEPIALAALSYGKWEPGAKAFYHVHVGRGCTVNACTGTEQTGLLRESLHQAQFETMEGAAFAYWGQQQGIPVEEVRAISNIASTRNMKLENIRSALAGLRHYLQRCKNLNV